MDGYTAVPQQCTVAFGHTLLHTVTDGCPMPGMAAVQLSDDETWIAQKVTVPAHAYAAILDGNPATDATLAVNVWCTYAVVPDSLATSYMCGGSGGGRRLMDKDDEETKALDNMNKSRLLQEESCELLGCDVQTVEAEIHIPYPVSGDFYVGVLDNNPQPEPAPLPISDPAAQLFQDSGFDTASAAGWFALALLIVFLFGNCFGKRKARKKEAKAAEKIEEGIAPVSKRAGTPPLPDVAA